MVSGRWKFFSIINCRKSKIFLLFRILTKNLTSNWGCFIRGHIFSPQSKSQTSCSIQSKFSILKLAKVQIRMRWNTTCVIFVRIFIVTGSCVEVFVEIVLGLSLQSFWCVHFSVFHLERTKRWWKKDLKMFVNFTFHLWNWFSNIFTSIWSELDESVKKLKKILTTKYDVFILILDLLDLEDVEQSWKPKNKVWLNLTDPKLSKKSFIEIFEICSLKIWIKTD